MKITLIRHGKPAFELSGNAQAKDLRNLAKSYDASGIIDEPPGKAIEAAKGHNMVICSDLTRSLESAESLGCPEIHLEESIFREIAIPHFSNGSMTLPISVWIVVLRSLWLLGFSKNGESFGNARYRAKQAAQKLIQLATQYENILLVGHGFINYFIAKELLANKWEGPSTPGRGYWEYSVYRSI